MVLHEHPRATVVSGGGRFADPWHPFPATSARLAAVADAAGFTVEVQDDVATALVRPAELLILNLGGPSEPDDREDALIRTALLDALARGSGVLALHAATMSFPAVPEWEPIAGGVWVEGESMHPPYGEASVRITDRGHPITDGLVDFSLLDERYSFLRMDPGVRVLAAHEHEGRMHPLVWTRTGTRVVVDALGHDAASYDSEPHRELLTRAMHRLAASR